MNEIFIDRNEPFQESTITLDGVDYIFRLKYAQREDRYRFSLYSPDETPIILGVKIVCYFSLVRNSPAGGPLGRFYAISSEAADDSPPGLGELGTREDNARVQLLYLSPGESLV